MVTLSHSLLVIVIDPRDTWMLGLSSTPSFLAISNLFFHSCLVPLS